MSLKLTEHLKLLHQTSTHLPLSEVIYLYAAICLYSTSSVRSDNLTQNRLRHPFKFIGKMSMQMRWNYAPIYKLIRMHA